MLTSGQLLDRYRLVAPLAEGGMAVVWQVRHELLGSEHALKVLRPELLHVDEARERFLAEGRIQAQLRHPHIAAVTDLVSEAGIAGLVMELLEGDTLEARLTRDGALGLATLVDVFLPVLDAVGHAHDHGVIHRDLKPSNLFLAQRTRGRVRPVVLDFGIARIAADERMSKIKTGVTLMGTRMGTPAYMSPEQIRDPRTVDARSDLYALGAILYEAAIGQIAFSAETEFELSQRIVAGHLEDPARRLSPEKAALADVIRRAMAVDPANRFADAMAFADELERAARGRAPARVGAVAPNVPPPSVPPPSAPPLNVAPPNAAPPVVPPPVSAPPLPPRVVAPPTPPPPRGSAGLPVPMLVPVAKGAPVPLVDDRYYIGALRGNVEVYPTGRQVRFSHAVVERRAGQWYVIDQGLSMPVLLDGERLRGEALLRSGMRVLVGDHLFKFEGAR